MSLNFPWRALELLLTIPLNYELRCFNSSLGWILVWAHKLYQACIKMSKNSNARYKESWELEVERSKRKHKDMFRGSSHCSTSPPSHRMISTMSIEDLPQRDLHWEIYNLQIRSTHLELSHTSTQEGTHKAKHKVKKITTWWSLRSQTRLGDLKRSQTKHLSQYKILEDSFTMKSSSMWEIKMFENKTTKKILEKNFLMNI